MPPPAFFQKLGCFVRHDFLSQEQCSEICTEMRAAAQAKGEVVGSRQTPEEPDLIDESVRRVLSAKVADPGKALVKLWLYRTEAGTGEPLSGDAHRRRWPSVPALPTEGVLPSASRRWSRLAAGHREPPRVNCHFFEPTIGVSSARLLMVAAPFGSTACSARLSGKTARFPSTPNRDCWWRSVPMFFMRKSLPVTFGERMTVVACDYRRLERVFFSARSHQSVLLQIYHQLEQDR